MDVNLPATSNGPFQMSALASSSFTIENSYLTPSRSPPAQHMQSDGSNLISSPSQNSRLGLSASCSTLDHARTHGVTLDCDHSATNSSNGTAVIVASKDGIAHTRLTGTENSSQRYSSEISQPAEPAAGSPSYGMTEMSHATQDLTQGPEHIAQTPAPSPVRPAQPVIPASASTQ